MPVIEDSKAGTARKRSGAWTLAAGLPFLALAALLVLFPVLKWEVQCGSLRITGATLQSQEDNPQGVSLVRENGNQYLNLRLGNWYWSVGIVH